MRGGLRGGRPAAGAASPSDLPSGFSGRDGRSFRRSPGRATSQYLLEARREQPYPGGRSGETARHPLDRVGDPLLEGWHPARAARRRRCGGRRYRESSPKAFGGSRSLTPHRPCDPDRVTDPHATDETRIDRWLCAVRLVKTRPLATRLCEGGHVLVNGSPAKPSTKVRAGDRVEALIAERERIVEVVRPMESHLGAPAPRPATWTTAQPSCRSRARDRPHPW